MFGLSVATELFQGSTERTWNCVLHFVHLIWTKLNHIRRPIMPRSRKRHHSRSRSRSRSHSPDRSHEREEKHKKNDSHDKDRDGKRRKIESYDSPHHKRSVSSTPECPQPEIIAEEESLKEVSGNEQMNPKNNEENKDIDNGDKNAFKEKPVNEVKSTLKEHMNAETENVQTKKHETTSENEKINIKELEENMEVAGEKEDDIDEKNSDNSVIFLDDSEDKIDPNKEDSRLMIKDKLEITPKKVSSPKQLQKKLESEKKREARQREKDEKERKRIEDKERIKQERIKKKEEKQKELEQKQKEKEMKEEQKKKEREEREEQKRKEREEKEQKRKEKEEKEEQKRKEREQEKLKKLQEIEEKNKEKQREEEKKQKTAAAFVNFFVPKKTDNTQEDRKIKLSQTSMFMAFEVKSDMKLPPARRKPLTEKDREILDNYFQHQDETASYITDLKLGKSRGKCSKTWPYEDTIEDDDVAIVENEGDLGETICEDKSKLQRVQAKFLKFHENRRPAYFGTWRKQSKIVTGRKPFGEDKELNYEEDSDDDWEEEEQGESLNGSDDEADKENEDEKDDYEVDNEFFVPHGHLSDDEIDDEETARLSPTSLKQKLKLLKDEFDLDMQSKMHKLKPRSIGCIWYNKDGSNVEEAIHKYLQPLTMITKGQIQIKKRSEILFNNGVSKKNKTPKDLDAEYIPMFLKVIHGNSNKRRVLVEQFMTYMANNGFTVDIKKTTLIKNLKNLATWKKCKENGPMKNKFCWFVNEDVEKKYNVELVLPNILEGDIKQ